MERQQDSLRSLDLSSLPPETTFHFSSQTKCSWIQFYPSMSYHISVAIFSKPVCFFFYLGDFLPSYYSVALSMLLLTTLIAKIYIMLQGKKRRKRHWCIIKLQVPVGIMSISFFSTWMFWFFSISVAHWFRMHTTEMLTFFWISILFFSLSSLVFLSHFGAYSTRQNGILDRNVRGSSVKP